MSPPHPPHSLHEGVTRHAAFHLGVHLAMDPLCYYGNHLIAKLYFSLEGEVLTMCHDCLQQLTELDTHTDRVVAHVQLMGIAAEEGEGGREEQAMEALWWQCISTGVAIM